MYLFAYRHLVMMRYMYQVYVLKNGSDTGRIFINRDNQFEGITVNSRYKEHHGTMNTCSL